MKISIVYVAACIYKKILGCLRNCSRVSRRGFYRGNTFVNVRPSFPKNYETRNYLCYLHHCLCLTPFIRVVSLLRWRLRIQASGRTYDGRTLTGYFSTSWWAEAKTRSVKNKAVENLARDRLSGYRT